MATFYFNAAVDYEWTELGNWWTDADCTVQATSLPTSADDVIILGTAYLGSNSGSTPTVANLTAPVASSTGSAADIEIDIIVTGMATFDANARYLFGTITGNATFNDYAENTGTIIGNATFNDSSYNSYGTVTGNATFSLSSAAIQLAGGYGGSYGSVSFAYEKGINGSSILGVI